MNKNMPDELAIFFASLKSGYASYRVDEPQDRENGRWFIDFNFPTNIYTVEYKNGLGFGFYHSDDYCYGEIPNYYLNSTDSLDKLRSLGVISSHSGVKTLELALTA